MTVAEACAQLDTARAHLEAALAILDGEAVPLLEDVRYGGAEHLAATIAEHRQTIADLAQNIGGVVEAGGDPAAYTFWWFREAVGMSHQECVDELPGDLRELYLEVAGR